MTTTINDPNDRPPMDLSMFRGNEPAKRALEVALAGHHPLHLIGPPGTGKSELRRIYRFLLHRTAPASIPPTTEHWPCPCGYRGAVERECTCSPAEVDRHRAKIHHTLDRLPSGIWAETVRPAGAEMAKAGPVGEGTERVLMRVRAAWEWGERQGRPTEMDDNAVRLLTTAYDRVPLSPAEWTAAVEVGATIAVLSKSETIRAPHVAEAIQYRAPKGLGR